MQKTCNAGQRHNAQEFQITEPSGVGSGGGIRAERYVSAANRERGPDSVPQGAGARPPSEARIGGQSRKEPALDQARQMVVGEQAQADGRAHPVIVHKGLEAAVAAAPPDQAVMVGHERSSGDQAGVIVEAPMQRAT